MVSFRRTQLAVEPSQPIVFVSPSDLPGSETFSQLSGTLTLSLSSKRAVPIIAVSFMRTGRSWDETLSKFEKWDRVISCCVVRESGELLEAGTHTFFWTISVPSSSAPTCSCALGEIQYMVEAVAANQGFFGGDLHSSRPIEVVVNPFGRGQAPVEFENHAEGMHEETGPWSLSSRAELLAAAGLLAFEVRLPSPPPGFELKRCMAAIEQTMTVAHPVSMPVDKQHSHVRLRRAWKIGAQDDPLSTIEIVDGQFIKSFVYRDIARLPIDADFKATSIRGSRTPFKVTHQLVLSFLYRQLDGTVHDATLRTRLKIAACCVGLDAQAPPEYAVSAPAGTIKRRKHKTAHDGCPCTMSTKSLADHFVAAHPLGASLPSISSKDADEDDDLHV